MSRYRVEGDDFSNQNIWIIAPAPLLENTLLCIPLEPPICVKVLNTFRMTDYNVVEVERIDFVHVEVDK